MTGRSEVFGGFSATASVMQSMFILTVDAAALQGGMQSPDLMGKLIETHAID